MMIHWKDIYEALEEAIDSCETAANTIGNIVVKNIAGEGWFTLFAVVGVALFFDFTNGFHDTANAIATASRPAR